MPARGETVALDLSRCTPLSPPSPLPPPVTRLRVSCFPRRGERGDLAPSSIGRNLYQIKPYARFHQPTTHHSPLFRLHGAAIQKIARLQHEAVPIDGHAGPVFGARDVVQMQGVVKDDVMPVHRLIVEVAGQDGAERAVDV